MEHTSLIILAGQFFGQGGMIKPEQTFSVVLAR